MVLLTNMDCTQTCMLAVWNNGGEPPQELGRSQPLNPWLQESSQSAPQGNLQPISHTLILTQVKEGY